MFVHHLRVENFRSHKNFDLALTSSMVMIVGENGSGKTSLIEAIYMLLRGKSFRASDIDVLKYDQSWFKVSGRFELSKRQFDREMRFELTKDGLRSKQFKVKNQLVKRLGKKDKYPVVLFEPSELNLINGSPTRRRSFIDELVSQIKPEHSTYLSRYDRALKQRNNLINQLCGSESGVDQEALFSWNILLSNYGAKIIRGRLEQIAQLNTLVSQTYLEITGAQDIVEIIYSDHYADLSQIEQQLFNSLSSQVYFTGSSTPFGPHRHDLIIKLNNAPAAQHASRGEVRSLILSLKIIETKIINQILSIKPIVLLDDVLSELDDKRKQALLTHLDQSQIIITSTEALEVPGLQLINLSSN